jgi:proteasome lid subunit RPN8/RPN11
MSHTPSAESFVRARLGNTVGNRAIQGVAPGASVVSTTTPSTSAGTWSTPTKKQLEGRPNPVNVLRFSPMAWSKLQWFRDRGSTEIGGFGISLKEEPLYVFDFLTVLQQCTTAGVEFDDDAVAKFLNDMDQSGYTPDEVLRVWLHTHPGNSASPSGTDMNTFRDVFGGSDWSIMVILAKGGECKARLRYTNGPGAELELTPQVDLHPPFEGVSGEDYQKWEEEYIANVRTRSYAVSSQHDYHSRSYYHGYGYGDDYEGWWNERQNAGTQGFQPSDTTKADASASHHSTSRYQSAREIARLADQVEIPPYGGMHRLASREADGSFKLIHECVEQVWQIDDNDDDTKTVITDLSWYCFSTKARVVAAIGDDIDSIHDISDESPVACGEVSWRVTKNDKLVPMKITRVLSSGQVIDLRANEAVAETELSVAKQKKTGGTDSTAGFAPSAAEKKDDKSEIISHPNWECVICGQQVDHRAAYMVSNSAKSHELGSRAHPDCVKNMKGWMMVPERPSKRETEIISSTVASAAAITRKENDEPGFEPAAATDSSAAAGAAANGSSDGAAITDAD